MVSVCENKQNSLFLKSAELSFNKAVTCAGRHQAGDQKEQTWKADLCYSPGAI